jgi:hypothetical protein
VPRAFKQTPETTPQRPFKLSPLAAEFVPRGFESPSEMSAVETKSAILGDTDRAPMMIPKRAPLLDIDSAIDRDISSTLRRKAPGKTFRSEFSADAPEFAPSQ